MINPEFRRNVWLELSPQRLILMVSVLGVIAALTVYLSDDLIKQGSTTHALLMVFSTLGLMLAGGWGCFTALACINSEVAGRADVRSSGARKRPDVAQWQCAAPHPLAAFGHCGLPGLALLDHG